MFRNVLWRKWKNGQETLMSKAYRTQLILGILLVLAGIWFIAVQEVPFLRAWASVAFEWPLYVVAAGVIIFIIGLATGEPRMAIPASLVAGIGGILYYQNMKDAYDSWSFLWTLIPGFVGAGTMLTGLLGEDTRHNLRRGLNLIVLSVILFLIFATLFHNLSLLGNYGLPVLLIFLGLYVIGRGLVGSRGTSEVTPDGGAGSVEVNEVKK
jgi:hypothetical protein